MHYKRLMRYGDPLGGGVIRGPNGEIETFLRNALASETDECILWPFYRDDNGYGRLTRDGKSQLAHVYVTKKKHGPNPPDKESCHSCGNGHLSCINHRHLRWGTRLENVHDAIAHGTAKFWGRHVKAAA